MSVCIDEMENNLCSASILGMLLLIISFTDANYNSIPVAGVNSGNVSLPIVVYFLFLLCGDNSRA